VKLPALLDLGAAASLRSNLMAARGAPLEIDGGDVDRLGGLCLQVLLSAKATWAADGYPLRFTNASPSMSEALRLMAAADLCEQGAA
jgi:chemotaxis protein CheX